MSKIENNLPQKYKENFFSKIFKKIKLVFLKSNVDSVDKVKINLVKTTSSKGNSKVNNFLTESDYKLKEDIKSMVENNHKLLRKLPYERLKQLEKLYDEEIERNNKEIEILDYQLENILD